MAATACNIRLIVETNIASHTGMAYVENNAQGTPSHHGFSLLISYPLYTAPGAARLDGLQPSLKNLRQKILPNGQTRHKFGFSYENLTTQSFSVPPTPFWLNVS